MAETIIDSSNIGEVINSFKSSVEPDSLLYAFEGMDPFCISREYMYKTTIDSKNVTHSIYIDVIQKYIVSNKLLYTYYKNKKGIWVNLDKVKYRNTSVEDIYEMCNIEEYYKGYIVDYRRIPQCYYTDIDGRKHPIAKGDGVGYNICSTDYINEINSNDIRISQDSIDKALAEGVDNHLKMDIKIEFLNRTSIDNILVWMNGIFVDFETKTGVDNVIYIRDGKRFLTTIPLTRDDSGKQVYYYNVDLRIFKWKGVNISPIIPTRFTKMTNLTSGRYTMGIVNEVHFAEDINPDAHIIMCNGQVLSPNVYTIDKDNPKHIYLTAVKTECEDLIRLVKERDKNNIYSDPFIILAGIFKNKVYTLVNFTSDNEDKLYLQRTQPLSKGFPGVRNFVFRNLYPKDLVLVNGLYYPYILTPTWYIEYPIENFLYLTEEFGSLMQSCDVYKIEFLKEKPLADVIKVEQEEPNLPPMPVEKNDGFDVDFEPLQQ